VRSAVTDTDGEIRFDPETKAGVSNLLTIHSAMSRRPVAELVAEYAGRGYGDLKKAVAEAVVAAVEPFQARMSELMDDPAELDRILAKGAARATEIARPTRDAVYDAVGVLPAQR
jgi:tryptophanyl-tRNA synthetase